MHFAFTDDQRALQDSVRSMLNSKSPPSVIRAGADGVWSELASLGVLGLTISEEAGGLGLGPCEWVLVCEEAGRAALPLPLTETLALGPLLVEAGLVALAGEVAAGSQRVTVGTSRWVDADRADAIFHLGPSQVTRFVAPQVTPLLSVSEQRRLFAVEGERQPVAGSAGGLRARLLLGTSAELLGLAARQLELAVAYSKGRQQFGKAIGSFQAVQHHLSNALLELSFARPVVYRAAWSLASAAQTGAVDEAAVHAEMAIAKASDAAYRVRRLALQVHGAIGYTREYDLHLWMKRSMALETAWGTAAEHRARIAESLHLP